MILSMESKDFSCAKNSELFAKSSQFEAAKNSSSSLDGYEDLTSVCADWAKKSSLRLNVINDQDNILELIDDIPLGCKIEGCLTIPTFQTCEFKLLNNEIRKIRINSHCHLAEKVVLRGFPPGQYILNVCGTNVASAKYTDGDYVIDLCAKENGIMSRRGINFTRCDRVYLCCKLPADFDVTSCKITVVGTYHVSPYLMKEFYGAVDVFVEPQNIMWELPFNGPTYQVLIENKTGYDGSVWVVADSIESDAIRFTGKYLLIRFDNKDINYRGAQDMYLSENLQQVTLNMSRVNSFRVIFEQTNTTHVFKATQAAFMSYKGSCPLFT